MLNQAMQDRHYVEQPMWQGRCCETTSLTRVDSPLLAILKQTYGNGLLTRLVARLTEIALLTDQLNPHSQAQFSTPTPEAAAANPGIGQAAAARGQLVHRVELDDAVIVNYQILAPTEWNFHPKGVVVESLLTLKGTSQQVEQQARLLINAIDPCVGYELNLRGTIMHEMSLCEGVLQILEDNARQQGFSQGQEPSGWRSATFPAWK